MLVVKGNQTDRWSDSLSVSQRTPTVCIVAHHVDQWIVLDCIADKHKTNTQLFFQLCQ